MGTDTRWYPEHIGGHATYCAHPYHSLMHYCAADPAEPETMKGKPSKAWHRDHPGRDMRFPLILAGRDELDLSQLRRHVNDMHASARLRGIPRANLDLAVWHFRQHHRYRPGHIHGGLWVMVRDARGTTIGQIARPLGWYTGQEPKTREQVDAEWRASLQNRRQQ